MNTKKYRLGGWDAISNMKDAAKYILDDLNFNGFLSPSQNEMLQLSSLTPKTILDFGCGIGRNLAFVSEFIPSCIEENSWGFDLPNMIILAKKYLSEERILGANNKINLTCNLEDIKYKKFDLVIACLVFQHIDPFLLEEEYYPSIQNMIGNSGFLWVHGRDWSDYNSKEIVWYRLEQYFELIDHPLSNIYKRNEFKNYYQPGDHHGGVFRSKKR